MLNIAKDIADLPNGESFIIFLGQAGFAFKSAAGTLIGLDLYLSDCVAEYDKYKRLMPYILEPDEIAFDALIATHAHYDHFDYGSMAQLMENGATKLYASHNCESEVLKLNMKNDGITYVKAGDTAVFRDIKLEFVFCDHGKSAPDAVGVVIDIDGKLVYIAGDTCLRLDKVSEITKGRTFDIMIAPINGAFGNLNEVEAVKLCEAVKPKIIIPCHFWNFAEHHGDPGKFIEETENKLPGQKYTLMRMGEISPL
ncbi:MAG: MBL fold metallo-hydrolase [Clostridiales bacterium]|jgi:L-ascorbate 6-phosphate lactonase|nr:MBL fold metallo-hydrolase [Clostridiales bacterium]